MLICKFFQLNYYNLYFWKHIEMSFSFNIVKITLYNTSVHDSFMSVILLPFYCSLIWAVSPWRLFPKCWKIFFSQREENSRLSDTMFWKPGKEASEMFVRHDFSARYFIHFWGIFFLSAISRYLMYISQFNFDFQLWISTWYISVPRKIFSKCVENTAKISQK